MTVPLETVLPGNGTLALVGSGEYLPGMKPVDQFLLNCLQVPAHVTCLPTAAGTEGNDRLKYWSNLGESHFLDMGVASVQSLSIIDRKSANDAELTRPLKRSNFIYLSGGKPSYLYKSIQGTETWQAIVGVLRNGGVVAGCSAGAMIFGESIPDLKLSSRFTHSGFGFLPGVFIVPHYDEIPAIIKIGISRLAKKMTMVGIDGYTALVCKQSGCTVVGKGAVTVIKDDRSQEFFQ